MNYTDFLAGGIASTGATFFTNPIEVIKTRIQLQGELAARGTYVENYRGVLHAFVTVAKNDGFLALQSGLAPALCFQFILNGFRLGIYNTAIEHGWTKTSSGSTSFSKSLFWGAFGGVLGSLLSSPFFMVKTQLQAQAVEKIAVGYQHKHTGMLNALSAIYSQGGLPALWRGAQSTIPRAALGSGAQLATFGTCKDLLREKDIVTHKFYNSFVAGAMAGSVMSFAITPPDVIATRLYNQGVDDKGKGLYYKGIIDCLVKILRTEGIYGLYKGFWPNYLRIAPHSTLVLFFFDYLLEIRAKYMSSEAFK